MFETVHAANTVGFKIIVPMKPIKTRDSVSPLYSVEALKQSHDRNLNQKLNMAQKNDHRVYRKTYNGVSRKYPKNEHLVEHPNHKPKHIENVVERDLTCSLEKENKIIEEVEKKRQAKWLSYGGCIPSILKSLEEIEDLDIALKPWEESLNNKERTIILKEQSNWSRAFEIFEWFKRKGCHELNVIHYNIMLRILGRAQRWSHLEKMWDSMIKERIVPTNSTYGTLIDVYSKGSRREEALLWLETMKRQGLEPDEVTMGIIIQTYKKAGEFEKAEQFYKNWSLGKSTADKIHATPQGHKALSSYTYNTLIDIYGKNGQLKEASDTFSQMLREGIVPNTVTFNTMIHICGNHDHLEEVSALMVKMEELQCLPDTRTYNILISLYAKNDNISMAARYFAEMKNAGLSPDIVSYRTLLYAFSIRRMVEEAESLVMEMEERGFDIDEYSQSAVTRMYIDSGMVEKSWSWFEKFHQQGKMNSECYSANIDAFGERGHLVEAENALSCSIKKKKVSVLEFNVMIKAYGICKEYEKACYLFDSMEKYGIHPDKCTYNSLIQILSSTDLPDKAFIYLEKMQKDGFATDCVPYCAVISSYTKLGRLETAGKIFNDMIDVGVQPDIIVFGILINGFANVGSVNQALKCVNAMKHAGFSGNSIIYNSLIKLYTKIGYLKEAQETYKLLQESDDGPDVYASNCMIDLYSERIMVKQAEEIFESLKQKRKANEFSFSMMLCMYKKVGRISDAIRIAQEMHEQGLIRDLLSYNHVISLYALDGRLKKAVNAFYHMSSSGVQPDDSTFRYLGIVLIKCGVSKNAINQLELTRKEDPQKGAIAWMKSLQSIVGNDNDLL